MLLLLLACTTASSPDPHTPAGPDAGPDTPAGPAAPAGPEGQDAPAGAAAASTPAQPKPDRSTNTSLLGATWYNLGRVREAQGRIDEAVAAYRTSLGLRANETVTRRLAALGGAAPLPFHAEPMAGPYSTLDAWCDARMLAHKDESEHLHCGQTGEDLGEFAGPRAATGAPFEEVRVIGLAAPMFGDGWDGGSAYYSLAVRTDAGW